MVTQQFFAAVRRRTRTGPEVQTAAEVARKEHGEGHEGDKAFGKWCEEKEFPFERTWRWWLMEAARNEAGIKEYVNTQVLTSEDELPDVKTLVNKVKRTQVRPVEQAEVPFPDGKYRCLVIDPPWPMEKLSRNATHGLQLSQEDKRDMARKIYAATAERDRKGKKEHLARLLSVSPSIVYEWLSRVDKDSKAARDKRIFDMWLACSTMEEIAQAEGITKETVSQICQKIPDLEKSDKLRADHAIDFEPPLYNVWKQQEKTAGSGHFGNSEGHRRHARALLAS